MKIFPERWRSFPEHRRIFPKRRGRTKYKIRDRQKGNVLLSKSIILITYVNDRIQNSNETILASIGFLLSREGTGLFACLLNLEFIELFSVVEEGDRQKGAKWLRIRDRVSTDGARTLPDVNGKEADSLFIKTETLKSADIYSVFIFTGRKHQIRFHASHYIAPIIGDTFYGSTTILPPDEIALMCRGYNIPYGKQTLRIRLPQRYLDRFFEKIKT